MHKKIFRSFFSLSFFIVILNSIFGLCIMYNYFTNQIENELKKEALYLSIGVEQFGVDYFDKIQQLDSRITLIDKDGVVLFDNKNDEQQMENHLDRQEIKQAMQTGEGVSTRYSKTTSSSMIYYAKLLPDGRVLRVSSRQFAVWQLLFNILKYVLLAVVIVLLLVWKISKILSKDIIKPINNINLDNPLESESYEELNYLIRKIDDQNKYISRQMQELRRKQEEFNIMTESMREGFIIVDNKTGVLSYNKSALKLLGIDEISENKSILSLNRSKSFTKAVELALKGEHNEQKIVVNNEYYQVIANPVYHNNIVNGVIIIIFDVTETQLREDLRREFTSNVSHELKTPLTTIYGVSDMIASGIVKADDIIGFAKNIKEESARLITLIDDILKLSQLDEQSLPIIREEVDIFALTTDIISRLDKIAKDSNIKVNLNGEHIKINCIKIIIDEVIYNLCENAIKYNKNGGSVDITLLKTNDKNTIIIEDTGIGIPKEDLNRIFERFFRVDKSHSRKIGGTGLGLAIVKHAVENMGGTIKVESQENVGTKFIIEI